ncbi:MAG: hypothetical protein JST00_47695 [Deltaproteobacteria bacterium]|nr:hypothetical protein [Deltaproteobacteria bacterium]
MMSRRFVFGLSVAIASLATVAHADPVCINAYEQAQTLRKDGKLVSAKAQAAICAHSDCPALLAKDCGRWLTELEASTPTVVFDARTPNGGERTDVRVKVDGTQVAPHIDGKAVPLDPGTKKIVFETDDASPVETTIVIKEGEKNRKVTLTVGSAAPAPVATSRPVPAGVWLFGGLSVAALTTSAVFAISGLAQKGDLDDCKPRCAASDIDAMSQTFTFADVFLGVGLMGAAATAWLYFTRPAVPEGKEGGAAAAAGLRLHPYAAPLPGGAGAGVSARF